MSENAILCFRFFIRCEELHLIDRCHQIQPRPSTFAEILLKHTRAQYDILKATEHETNEQKLEDLSSHYDAIYVHPVSFQILFFFRPNRFQYKEFSLILQKKYRAALT